MRHLLRLTDLNEREILKIFDIADNADDYSGVLSGKAVALFFPPSSVLTRGTFELAVHRLGGESILFSNELFDKVESASDRLRYFNNWFYGFIVRSKNLEVLDELSAFCSVPMINAMTNVNHPCEIISDLYALSKRREDWRSLNYLFVGACTNIGLTWQEASMVLGLNLTQSCPEGYEMPNVKVEHDIRAAIREADIVLTDPFPEDQAAVFMPYQVSVELLESARKNALLNPCPPFHRGEEVSADSVTSDFFVGYDFKQGLVVVEEAILLWCMGVSR